MKVSDLNLSVPNFVLAAPRMAQVMSFLIVLGFTGGYVAGFKPLTELLGKTHMGWMVWIPAPLIAFSLWAVLRPGYWESWINFAADTRGIYIVYDHRNNFLHIPWGRVGHISLGTLGGGGSVESGSGQSTGLIIEVKLTDEDRRKLKPMDEFANLSNLLLGSPPTKNEYTKIGIGNNARSPRKTLNAVIELKKQYGRRTRQ